MAALAGSILGVGNPLLDISANVGEDMLQKYDVKLNNAILAEEKHIPVYEELAEKYEAEYIAGGATQNSIRVAQWMLQTEGATSFIGCVGDDKFGKELEKCATSDGVKVHYRKDAETPTGTCAVLVKDQERSLIANLAAANKYQIDHMESDESRTIYEAAKIVYIAGFFLTVSPPTIMKLAEHCHDNNKTFIMNLSAPFISQFFGEPLAAAMPFVDVIVGNESEAEAFAEANKLEDKTPQGVCKYLANMPKKNVDRPRVAIITQGPLATIVCIGDKATEYPVTPIAKEEIVDANGAGDAFVGGFLSKFVQGKDMAECVAAGQYAAGVILRVSGTVLPATKPEL